MLQLTPSGQEGCRYQCREDQHTSNHDDGNDAATVDVLAIKAPATKVLAACGSCRGSRSGILLKPKAVAHLLDGGLCSIYMWSEEVSLTRSRSMHFSLLLMCIIA